MGLPKADKGSHLAVDGFLRTPLKLVGGKTGRTLISGRSRMYEEFVEHDLYLEPFIGSGSVLIGKTKEGREVVNDICPWVINYFRCLKRDRFALWWWMQQYVGGMCKDKFKHIQSHLPSLKEQGGMPAAAAFYAITKFGRGGIWRFNDRGEQNSSFGGLTVGRGLLDLDWYEKVYYRIKDVKFYCGGYEQFLDEVLREPKGAFIVLDPPYLEVLTRYDRIKWSRRDHFELAKRLHHLDKRGARWLVTINDHPTARKLYKRFRISHMELQYSISNTEAGRTLRQELICTNY